MDISLFIKAIFGIMEVYPETSLTIPSWTYGRLRAHKLYKIIEYFCIHNKMHYSFLYVGSPVIIML